LLNDNRPHKAISPLAMGLAAMLLWPAPASAALSERGGTGIWEVQSAESHRPARLELGLFTTYQRLGLRDSADTQLNELIGGANAVFGIPGGFEVSGMVPFYNDYTTLGSGATPNDNAIEPKLGDVTARLRWTGPFLLRGLRWGFEGEAAFATGNTDMSSYPGRAPTRLYTSSDNSYTGRGMVTWDGLRAGTGVPLRLHGNAGYTFQEDDSRYLLPQTPLPLEVPAPTRNRDNDYLTLGAAAEIDLPRMTLFGEVVTNQFVYDRTFIKGKESRVVVTPGVRFWLPGGVSIGGAWSFNISDDDAATAFDPGRAFPKDQWRVAISLGTVYRGASAKAEDVMAAAAPAPVPAIAPKADRATVERDSLAAEKEKQRLEILERRGVQEAKKDTLAAKPAAPAPPAVGPRVAPAPPATVGPLTDTDRDGIPDVSDQCPLQPEDWDGFQDFDGCPDLDNDQDGIPDIRDQCPNDPETYNGYYDFDGCPDEFQRRWIGERKGVTPAPDMSGFDAGDGSAAAEEQLGPSIRDTTTLMQPAPRVPVVPSTARTPAPSTPAAVNASRVDSLRTALEVQKARLAMLEARAQRADAERLAVLERVPAADSVARQQSAEAAARLAEIEARQEMWMERDRLAARTVTDSALARASAEELRQMIRADRERQAEMAARLQILEARQQMLVDRPESRSGPGATTVVTPRPASPGPTTIVRPRASDTAEAADLAARIAVLEARLASRTAVVTPPETVPATRPAPTASPEMMQRLNALEDSVAALSGTVTARAGEQQSGARANLDAILPVGVTRVFPEITFTTRSAGLDAAGAARVNALAKALRDVHDAMVRVVGHTDNRGLASVNLQLSRARAATVADMMFALGVNRDQLVVEGRGESDPMADNATVDGRRANRRVEFIRIR
jgi:outer membrane protein OmpA-like peptidoglycan-associated protein